jgi:hypothetical protein
MANKKNGLVCGFHGDLEKIAKGNAQAIVELKIEIAKIKAMSRVLLLIIPPVIGMFLKIFGML